MHSDIPSLVLIIWQGYLQSAEFNVAYKTLAGWKKTTLGTENCLAVATEVSVLVNLHFIQAIFAALGSLFLIQHLQKKKWSQEMSPRRARTKY